MKAPLPIGLLSVALLGCTLASCSNSDSDSVAVKTENVTGITPEINFLAAMPSAPFRTNYRGVRRLEFHLDNAGIPTVLAYREEVGSNGTGKFAIETIEALSILRDPDLFLLLQDQRQGFTYRYRDFQVRDRALFDQNYDVVVVAGPTVVANTDCIQIHVQLRNNPVRFYLADVHARSGLVLRWEERELSTNSLLGRMEFETFQLGADVSDMNLRDRLFPAAPIDLSGDTGAQVGFEVLQPTDIPTGFQVEFAESLIDDLGRTWAKLVYSDGVDRVVFMHRAQTQGEILPGLVESLTVGPWTAVFGEVNGYPVIVMGKVAEPELLDLLKIGG
jgi:hypothetical protein